MRERVIETNQGIQGELNVKIFDEFAKFMRDKGWIETKAILGAGLISGHGLEVGPGPGIKGLEWLKNTKDTTLVGLEISENMIKIARENAKEYGFSNRVEYVHKNATKGFDMEDETFDVVFSTGSLHEWEKPINVFNEMYRVVKKGGKIFVSDLRRDLRWIAKNMMLMSIKDKAMKPGFISSLNAAYTVEEIRGILKKTDIKQFNVTKDSFGLQIVCYK
jgi:ubiquinone/menaquinone biosynthesis C-methylase UbiE